MAKRIQRQRTKGWRMPEGAVYVGRPSKWGNPYAMGGVTLMGISYGPHSRADVVRLYSENVLFSHTELSEIRGRDLVCWCPLDQPCHADVLLEWANSAEPQS